MCKRLAGIAAAVALVWTGQANADQIPIQNGSFDNPSLTNGGYTRQTPGWVSNNAFIFSPVIGVNVKSVEGATQVAAVGNVVGPGSLYQDLGVPVVAGQPYTLFLSIGSRLEGYGSHPLIELLAGKTPFGQWKGIDASSNGLFLNVTFVATGAGTGDLGLLLAETGAGQTLFANVAVFSGDDVATIQDAPEPASLTLFGIGAAGLAGYGWRRRLLRWV